ncbi:hypothetical protein Taro_040387, partial [Colocasia esculenta]|nr:hypothetical protein [Colocasia esculenta]
TLRVETSSTPLYLLSASQPRPNRAALAEGSRTRAEESSIIFVQQASVEAAALMASDLKERAKEAFVDDNFELAVELYTQALGMDPRNADLLADRAQANIKLKSFTGTVLRRCRLLFLRLGLRLDHMNKLFSLALTAFVFMNGTEAVADANKAIELDPSMSKAYLRKGTACKMLEEYQTAKAALEAGAALAPGDLRFAKLIKECDERIAGTTRRTMTRGEQS